MHRCRIATLTISVLLPVGAFAANPFLDAPDDKPVSAKFRGTEWSDEVSAGEIPLTARVVTTRVAKLPWGALLKIEFADLKSRSPRKGVIRRDHLRVTVHRILLLNEHKNDDRFKHVSRVEDAPESD